MILGLSRSGRVCVVALCAAALFAVSFCFLVARSERATLLPIGVVSAALAAGSNSETGPASVRTCAYANFHYASAEGFSAFMPPAAQARIGLVVSAGPALAAHHPLLPLRPPKSDA